MQKLPNYYSLYEMEPELVKEWHPTANGNLTPRNVNIFYPNAIWWICSRSHEWEETIKNRISGTGCPVCGIDLVNKKPLGDKSISMQTKPLENEKFALKKPNIAYESISSDTYSGNDIRKSRRFKGNGAVIIEIPSSGHWFYAELKNFSADGMCFEIEAAIRPRTKIKIKSNRPLFLSTQKSYSSTVRWCKALDDDSQFPSVYGIGVKFN